MSSGSGSTMTSNSLLSDEVNHSSFDNDTNNNNDYSIIDEGGGISPPSFGGQEEYEDEYDDDEEQKLSWRLDPLHSHSDWTLVITTTNSSSSSSLSSLSDTYHVHKNILAVGPCRSDYFTSLFRSTHLAESSTNTSHIVLEEQAANAMPILLDFMYDIPRHNLDITTKHVVALRYLAKYFGIRILYRKVMDYHRRDMTLTNLGTYIADAVVFHDETTLSLAATKCLDNLQHMDDALLGQMDPPFLLRILSNPNVDTCSVSCQFSKLLVDYCQIHMDELSMEVFTQLTDRKYIPRIDRDAAVPLLELEVAIAAGGHTDDEKHDRERGCNNGRPTVTTTTAASATSSSSPSVLSCLQNRCIKVLALHWKDFAERDKMPSSTLQKLPSAVLVQLMEKTVLVAKQNHVDVERSKLTDSMSLLEQVEELKKQRVEAKSVHRMELEQCRQEGRDKANRLRSLLAEKDRQIVEYRREWDKMVRVPPDYDRFLDQRVSTFHHEAANEPFDSTSGRDIGRFGRLRPTSMPRIGDSSEDGYLVIDTDVVPPRRWPVFYYKDD